MYYDNKNYEVIHHSVLIITIGKMFIFICVTMELDNIKTEYRSFLEHFSYTHSSLEDLVKSLTTFLLEYVQNKDIDYSFAHKLEENLICLEFLYLYIDEVYNKIDTLTLSNLQLPKVEKNKKWQNVSLFIPKDYDKSIYVEKDTNINLDIFQR